MSAITLQLVHSRSPRKAEFERQISPLVNAQGQPLYAGDYHRASAQPSRLYAGDYMDTSGWMDSSGELDAGKVLDRIKNARFERAGRVQDRMQQRGAPAAQGPAVNPIVETVQTAQAIQTAQRIKDRADYDWPDTLSIVAPAAFLAAASVNNGNGVQPPRGFFAQKIVVLGADLISVERFEIMGESIVHGASSSIASQWRTDGTANIDLNLPVDTVPIIFSGTCITAGVIGVAMVGFLRKMGGRRA